MQDLKALDALNAYGKAVQSGGGAVPEQDQGVSGDGLTFKDMLDQSMESAGKTAAAGEVATMQALTKETDLVNVVTAVTSAELAVETVVAIRDRVVQAYNDIIKMPI